MKKHNFFTSINIFKSLTYIIYNKIIENNSYNSLKKFVVGNFSLNFIKKNYFFINTLRISKKFIILLLQIILKLAVLLVFLQHSSITPPTI